MSVETSPFVPVALGFFGLGTGYLIWRPQELFVPRSDVVPGLHRPRAVHGGGGVLGMFATVVDTALGYGWPA